DPLDDGVQVHLRDDPVDDRREHDRVETNEDSHHVDAIDELLDVDLGQQLVQVDAADERFHVDSVNDGLDVDTVDHLADVDRVDDHRCDLVHHRLEDRGGVFFQRVDERGTTRAPYRKLDVRINRHGASASRGRSGGSPAGSASLRGDVRLWCIGTERLGQALDEQVGVRDRVRID